MRKAPTKITLGFALSNLDRAIKECLADRSFGSNEIDIARAYFDKGGKNPKCLYCNLALATRWDHLHPITKGGDTVLGNMVPACASCDDSKRHLDLDEWLDSAAKKKPPLRRHEKIRSDVAAYRRHFRYSPRPFKAKLGRADKKRYHAFSVRVEELRRFLKDQNWM